MGLSSTSGRRASSNDRRPARLAGHKTASEMSESAEPIRQLDTHRRLVSQMEQWRFGARLSLGAVIVPASRPAPNLEQTISLARASRCALRILCSRRVESAEVHELLAKRSFNDAIVVDLPDDHRHKLFDFQALESINDDLPTDFSCYAADLSMLGSCRTSGMRVTDFPDNSVACHAHRAVGRSKPGGMVDQEVRPRSPPRHSPSCRLDKASIT